MQRICKIYLKKDRILPISCLRLYINFLEKFYLEPPPDPPPKDPPPPPKDVDPPEPAATKLE